MKLLEALKPVFTNGRVIESGSKFSCSDDFAKRLIKNKSARLFHQEEQENLNDKNDDLDYERKKLESLTKDELLKLAQEKGIDGLNDKNKKDEIIEALMEAAGING